MTTVRLFAAALLLPALILAAIAAAIGSIAHRRRRRRHAVSEGGIRSLRHHNRSDLGRHEMVEDDTEHRKPGTPGFSRMIEALSGEKQRRCR
jgi:hypothetical protein